MAAKGSRGSSFESFLEEEGILDEVKASAAKKLLAYQLEEARKKKRITKESLAKRAGTSRAQINRVLDPANNNVTIAAVRRVAQALGKDVRLEVV